MGGNADYRRRRRRSRLWLYGFAAALWNHVAPAVGQDIPIINEGNATLLPTVVDPASNNPTDAPTVPTSAPSPAPSSSASPTELPSVSPTNQPTTTVSPSQFPSTTFLPSYTPSVSLMPSVSLQPSSTPSVGPTGIPSAVPTPAPSSTPSISPAPTVSAAPSTSHQPTASSQPSNSPTMTPSESPTMFPTVSALPSSLPSISPSLHPSASVQPSSQPSVSHAPTQSAQPSSVPSSFPTDLPSNSPSMSLLPSASPSNSPSQIPTPEVTGSPTLLEVTITHPSIVMLFSDLDEELNETQQEDWINITEQHIFDYWDSIDSSLPGIIPVKIYEVYDTVIRSQFFPDDAQLPSNGGGAVLAIEYSQTITYGVYTTDNAYESDDLAKEIFQYPFFYDSQSYLVQLIQAWTLDHWIDVVGVIVGDTLAPTASPVVEVNGSDTNLSRSAVIAISASIILSSILLVAFLFWDRHRKEKIYLQSREFEGMEFEGNGSPGEWRSPYTIELSGSGDELADLGIQSPSQDRPSRGHSRHTSDSDTSNPTTTSFSHITGAASGIPNRNNGHVSHLPPLPSHNPRASSLTNRVLMTPPMDRHTSIADTEITDLTYSDGQGGGRSDNGSDGDRVGPPMLPTISDDQYGDRMPWSPLRIPDDDRYGGLDESPSQDMVLGLTPSEDSNLPSMNGFQMEVQELE